jgi:carboxylate-amine ligase
MPSLPFNRSDPFTLGVELELQVVNRRDYDLTAAAPDLLALTQKQPHPGEIKPEITQSMVEVSTSVQRGHESLLAELKEIRAAVVKPAERLNLGIAGGGTHPFQRWSDRRIFSTPRFDHLSELYGYLAKQFTVFGQHVHIGCEDGDRAVRLIHLLSRFVPHFIALSASSPFLQGVDTAFNSSRLNSVNAFPLSGHIPFVGDWPEFEEYFERMQALHVVESMKDFYWDIRPKPEYGTVEIRVCDTPLTVERAAALAAYAQALARWLLTERPLEPVLDVYSVYGYNKFLACRFGLQAEIIDAYTREKIPIAQDIDRALEAVLSHAADASGAQALGQLRALAAQGSNDSVWLREQFAQAGSLQDVVRRAAQLWMQQ